MKQCKRLLALALCTLMLLTMTGCTDSMTYRKAKNLHTTGDYEEAIELFEKLGDYGDSKDMIGVCYYELGREAMLEEKWQEAIGYFEQSNYHGAAERIRECQDKLAE